MHTGIRPEQILGNDVFFEILEPSELEFTYRVKPAKNFGSSFANLKFKGRSFLVEAIPADACSEIVNHDDLSGNIALVGRG